PVPTAHEAAAGRGCRFALRAAPAAGPKRVARALSPLRRRIRDPGDRSPQELRGAGGSCSGARRALQKGGLNFDKSGPIMMYMKTASIRMPKGTNAHEELLAAELAADPEFAHEWERLALARTVAVGLIGFRSDNQLSQRELAELLGVSQPRVVELESGEKN